MPLIHIQIGTSDQQVQSLMELGPLFYDMSFANISVLAVYMVDKL